MTVVKKVKTAIIGCGAISQSYIESLQTKFTLYHVQESLHGLVRSGEQHRFSPILSTFLPPAALAAGYPDKTYLGSKSESALAL